MANNAEKIFFCAAVGNRIGYMGDPDAHLKIQYDRERVLAGDQLEATCPYTVGAIFIHRWIREDDMVVIGMTCEMCDFYTDEPVGKVDNTNT